MISPKSANALSKGNYLCKVRYEYAGVPMAQEVVVAEEAGLLGGKLIPIIVVLIVVAAGAAGAYFFLFKDDGDTGDDGNGDNGNGGDDGNNTDDNGGGGGGNSTITATFTYTWEDDDYNEEISVKETVTFDASGSTGGQYYYWDWGDGFVDNSGDAIVTKYFTASGTFNVTVNVSDDDGWDEYTKIITVTEVSNPEITLNALTEEDYHPIGQINNNITWRVVVQSASGTNSQMSWTNIRVTINRSGSNESYFTSLVSDLTPISPPITSPQISDIYYQDTDISGAVSPTDNFPIAGDGGIDGYDVQSGDVFGIWFEPSGEMLDQVTIP